MANAKHLKEYFKVKNAIAPIQSSNGPLTGEIINGTGFDRAYFVFTFGTPLATASVSTGAGIWKATAGNSSSGAYTQMTSASFGTITSGSMSNHNLCIDVKIDQAYPWLMVSNMSLANTNVPLAVVCILANPNERPPASGSTAIVTVD